MSGSALASWDSSTRSVAVPCVLMFLNDIVHPVTINDSETHIQNSKKNVRMVFDMFKIPLFLCMTCS